MTAQEYLAIKARMCNTYEECQNCPFGEGNCSQVEYDTPEEAERLVLQWKTEHPVVTNENKFKEIFGFYPYYNIYNKLSRKNECAPHLNLLDYNWWQKEYKNNT